MGRISVGEKGVVLGDGGAFCDSWGRGSAPITAMMLDLFKNTLGIKRRGLFFWFLCLANPKILQITQAPPLVP